MLLKIKFPILLLALVPLAILLASAVTYAARINPPDLMPEFTQTDTAAWINSEPLTTSDLRGKVVLIDVWTYGCWNCYNSFPWLRSVEEKFVDQDFVVVGIHTPEFDHEKDRENIVKKVEEFKLHHPVMIDNDFAYWRSLNNKYWPSYYIVDKKGKIRKGFIGETHEGDPRAHKIENLIAELLEE